MMKTTKMNTLTKNIMKGRVFLFLLIINIAFMSCSSDDDTLN